METTIVGCTRCGWVARPDYFATERPFCVECGGILEPMRLEVARKLVSARRRAERRRTEARVAAEIGL
jgi:hypothetical protein